MELHEITEEFVARYARPTKKEIIYHFFRCLQYLCIHPYPEGANLSSHRLVHLEVVDVQVALEIEVGQLVLRLQVQQLAQLGVRGDIMLVLQVVLLHVGRDGLRHVGAALQAARGAAQERAQLVGQRRGHQEDARLRRLALRTLRGGLLAATALVRHLLQLGRTLLQLLGLRHQRVHLLTHRQQRRRHRLHLLLQTSLLHRRRGLGRRSNHRGRHRRRRGHRSSLGLRRLLRLRRRRGRRGRRRSSHLHHNLLLRYLLRTLRRRTSRRVHYTISGGRIGRHFTHY
jgi:hypothetical protein